MSLGTTIRGNHVTGSCAPISEQPCDARINAAVNAMNHNIDNLASIEASLDAVADRLFGSTPEAVSEPKGAGQSSAELARLDSAVDTLGCVIARLQRTTARLQNI